MNAGVAAALLAGLAVLPVFPAPASEALADRHACLNCHQVDRKLVGPAFKAVAERYRGQADAAERLRARIAQGGVGAWGQVPMPAMPLPPEDAQALVTWVLGL